MRRAMLLAGLSKLKSRMPEMAGCDFKTCEGIEGHAGLGHSASSGQYSDWHPVSYSNHIALISSMHICIYQFAIVSNIVSHRRLRWLGRLARMLDERLPKRVLFGHMDGSGLRGRSQKQWVATMDYVREDLHFAELSITWWRKSQDRAGWRAAIECLLQRT